MLAGTFVAAGAAPRQEPPADPSSRSLALFGQALLALERGDDADAERRLRRVKELDPASIAVRFKLAETLLRRESWAALEAECEEIIERWPGGVEALRLQASARAARGDLDGAEASFRDAMAASPGQLELYGELAQLLSQRGRVLEAIGVLESATEVAPEEPGLWIRIARAYAILAQQRRTEAPAEVRELGLKAIAAFDRAAALDEEAFDEVHHRLATADVSALIGDLPQAIAGYERVLELQPHLDEVRTHLAEAYCVGGDLEKGIGQLELLRERQPLNKDFAYQLAGLYWQTGRREKAITACRESLAIEPKQPEVQLALADFLRALGRLDEAQGVLEQARSLSPENPQVLWMLGLCVFQRGRYAEARTLWESCLELTARNDPPRPLPALFFFHYGVVLEQLRDWPAAVTAYRKAVAADPSNLDLRRRLIVSLEEVGAAEEAAQVMAETAHLDGVGELAQAVLRAQIALDRHIYDEAAVAFDEALGLASREEPPVEEEELADLLFMAGAANERSGRVERSVELLQRSLALQPKNAEALNYLGYMWADRGERLDEAKRLIEQALELSPDNGAYLDSLGWVHYRLGDLEKALTLLRRAADLVGDDAVVFDHLGQVYWDLGQRGLAVQQWRRAAELDPANEEIRRRLAASEESARAADH